MVMCVLHDNSTTLVYPSVLSTTRNTLIIMSNNIVTLLRTVLPNFMTMCIPKTNILFLTTVQGLLANFVSFCMNDHRSAGCAFVIIVRRLRIV